MARVIFGKVVRGVICAALVLIAGIGWADPIVVDSFDGEDGTGLSTYDSDYSAVAPIPTSANKKAEIDTPGLEISGKYSAGNSLYMSLPDPGYALYRFANSADLSDFTVHSSDAVTTVYMSALFKAGADDLLINTSKLYVELSVQKGSGGSRYQQMGIYRNDDDELAIYTNSTGDFTGNLNNLGLYTADETIQLVMKINVFKLDADSDRILTYFALNPSVGVEPTWTVVGGGSQSDNNAGFLFYEFSVAAAKPSNDGAVAQGWIDEIRIGRTYDDVVVAAAVPEPGTILLVGTGLLGGLSWLRKRRIR